MPSDCVVVRGGDRRDGAGAGARTEVSRAVAGAAAVLPRAVATVAPVRRLDWIPPGGRRDGRRGDQSPTRAAALRSEREERPRLPEEPADRVDTGGLGRAVVHPAGWIQPEPAAGEGGGGPAVRSAESVDRRVPVAGGRDAAPPRELREPDRRGARPLGHAHVGLSRRAARGEACGRHVAGGRPRRRGTVRQLGALRGVRVRDRQRAVAAARHHAGRDARSGLGGAGPEPRR